MEQKITFGGAIKGTFHSLKTWEWTKRFLHWLIISAGTMSECVFLVASLWVSINANVHAFVLLFISDAITKHITELATTAYVALPECIVGLAVVVTLSHLRVWRYNKKDFRAFIWMVLYGLPTLVFLGLSLITLGNAVASVDFQMPTGLVVTRALAGYMFAFTSLLYTQIGVPQERDRLEEKDDLIADIQQKGVVVLADLRREKDTMLADLHRNTQTIIDDLRREKQVLETAVENQKAEIEKQKGLLLESQNAQSELLKALDKSDETALQGYGDECIHWLKSGAKTANLEEITRYTGHSKRKIEGAITKGNLQTAPRNKELILLSSLAAWLKTVQPRGTDEGPTLRIVNE